MNIALVLVCALLLDAALGEPRWLWSRAPHPAVLMGRLIERLDRSFNAGTGRLAKGVACLSAVVAVAVMLGLAIGILGPVAEIIVAAILLAQRSLVEHVTAVADGLRRSVAEGRAAVAMIVSRDTSAMDESQTARAAIESAAENLSDGVIAPAFWLLVGGLPGLLAYKMVNTADSMIGYRTPRHEAFGWAAARTDDLLNLVPARVTAALIALPAKQFDAAAISADAGLHRSPNAGWPEAAMSRALGIALSGPRAYDGRLQDFPWVNAAGRRNLTSVDIDETIVMLWKAWALMLVVCALFGVLFL